jgi:hypothetical protein
MLDALQKDVSSFAHTYKDSAGRDKGIISFTQSEETSLDTLVERGVISNPQIEDGPKSANGVVEVVYLVGKRDSYIIVAQLSPEFTAKLVRLMIAPHDRSTEEQRAETSQRTGFLCSLSGHLAAGNI